MFSLSALILLKGRAGSRSRQALYRPKIVVRTTGPLTAGRNPGGQNGSLLPHRCKTEVTTLLPKGNCPPSPDCGSGRPSPPGGCFCLNVHQPPSGSPLRARCPAPPFPGQPARRQDGLHGVIHTPDSAPPGNGDSLSQNQQTSL